MTPPRSGSKLKPANEIGARQEAGIQDAHPIALLAGLDTGTVEACLRLLGEELRFLVADSREEAVRLLVDPQSASRETAS